MASVTLEEYELLGDAKYRSYVSAVDKVLKNFEYTSEWADLISALGKLNKVLLNHLKYPVIPRRIVISKRLAQCLHPALPSGVHLKALETYDIVFKCIGTNRLSQELFIYSAGLFPLLGNAAMNVRPALLNIYENHFVPLAERLRPGLSGFLTGVLSGLEEGSEYHERTNALLEKVCEGVHQSFFYGCLWECVLTNPSVRLPAVSFVLAHFNKKQSMEDQLHIMGTNVDVLVKALCAAVQDNSVLVQRSVLDLLLLGFPMHNSQLIRSDMECIQTAAVGVVLRRDMSLNRRLYAWLLGTEVNMAYLPSADKPRCNSVASSESGNINLYFDTYSRDLLVEALRTCLKGHKTAWGHSGPDLRPYRILISLLDKPEIGSVILDDVLVEVFRALYHEGASQKAELNELETKVSSSCSSASSRTQKSKGGSGADGKSYSELLKTANLLFGTLEPYYIWEYVGILFSRACAVLSDPQQEDSGVREVGQGSPTVLEICLLIEYLLEVVTIETYVEIQTEHLPELLRSLVSSLGSHCMVLSPSELTASLRLCSRILTKVQPPPVAAGGNSDEKSALSRSVSRETLILEDTREAKSEAETTPRVAFSPAKENVTVKTEGAAIGGHGDAPPAESNSLSDLERSDVEQYVSSPDVCARRTLVHSCVQVFEDFFVQLASRRLFRNHKDYEAAFKRLVVPRQESDSERKQRLEHLLKRCLGADELDNTSSSSSSPSHESLSSTRTSSSASSNCPREQSYTNNVQQCNVDTVSSVSELTKAFSYACQMLVEFSSFPMYCKQSLSTQVVIGHKHSSDESSLPDWLQILLVTAAYVRDIELQFVSIATLLDLITITRSVVSERQSKPSNSSNWSESSPQGTVAVVIVPLLEIGYLDFLDNSTCFYQVVAHQLWQLLGQRSLCYHRRTAELLHQLHSLSPNDNLVEDVIGHSMAQGEELLQVEAFRRFAVFWHLIRDLPTKMSWMGTVRMYDRCLFVMLDCLHQDIGPQRIEVQSWLTHSLQRGDAARLLEPLLIVLLDSDTARVSVQHVSIQRPCRVRLAENEDDGSSSEAKIYAISSVEGHIFYHVSDEPRQAVAVSGSRNPRRVFALTSLTGESSSQVVTANAGVTDFDLPSSHERGVRTPILLFINPIGGIAWNEDIESSSMPDLSNVRRIDTSSLRQEFSFDDIETSTENRGSSCDINRTVCDENQISASDENLTSTCEENQTPNCDEMKELTSKEVVESILDELVSITISHQDDAPSVSPSESGSGDGIVLEDPGPLKLSESSSSSSSDVHFGRSVKSVSDAEDISIHPLHTHLLLYWQVYDSQRVLYSFNVLRSLVQANPRLALCTLSSCSLSSARSPRHTQLHNLLARHRRSMFGKGFHGDLPAEAVTAFRSNMLLEILISVSLYFVRSFYPNLAQMRLTEEELSGNREVQLAAVELLNLLLSELVPIVKGGARGFASYIYDVLSRCRVQKTLLHCLLSTVYAASKQQPKDVPIPQEKNGCESTGLTFTEAILDFNEVPHSPSTAMSDASKETNSDYSESFQVCVLRLLLVLIILEDEVTIQKGSDRDSVKTESVDRSRTGSQQQQTQGSTVRYQQGLSIPCQPMFLTAILCALKQQRTRPLHRHWLALVTSALPFLGKSLAHIVITIINQLCQNLEMLAAQYQQKPSDVLALSEISGAPVDYVMTLLDGLTTLCHYCVLDSSSQLSTVLTQPHIMSVQNPNMPEPVHAGQIISNLINVFTPSTIQRDLGSNRDSAPPVDPLIAARRSLLSHLPRLVSALSTMWQAMLTAEKASAGEQHPCWIMGTPKAVKQRILEFLSPVSHHHGLNFMAAIAVAWTEKRKKGPISTKKVIPASSDKQLVLVNLVSAIKVMPMDTLVQTVRQVIKQPPPTNSAAAKVIPLEVSMLQFFYSYVQTMTGSVLLESWPSLLGLLKEGLQLGLVPPAQFLLLGILNEFVQHAAMPEDKKDQKDLQDIAQKLIEAVSAVAGACLEQTTWLRRSLAVRPGPQPDMPDSDSELDDFGSKTNIELKDAVSETTKKNMSGRVVPSSDASQYSVQALSILAELLAPMLDVIYVSDEKEKVVPLLNNIMYNVTPYLRNHSQHNIPSFRACSVLLASLSGYQYTRKAWRRDALELLLDPSFFQITEACLGYWQTTVDNLMTHDRSTFRDLMARVAMTQSGSLNLFSSKEQEWEQRAQLLKRVAFVIFSGEVDQYQNCMPEIHERLSESLRLPQVPSVQSQVFLCFRVLLLRMSPQHITSLWPIIITEMVQVFLQIEQELNTDSEAFSSHLRRLSTLDSSWVVSSNNGLNAHNHPAWLQLYLAVCKLLDLALALPADRLPQFQMYRWAFVGEGNALSPTTNNNNINVSKPSLGIGSSGAAHPGFVPHIIRLAQLLNKKVSSQEKLNVRPGHPLLNVTNLKSLLDLQPFFHTLVSRQPATDLPPTSTAGGTAFSRQTSDESTIEGLLTANQKVSVTYIEKIVQRDFLESMAVS